MPDLLERDTSNPPDTIVLTVPIEKDVEVAEDLLVPAGIVDLESFRQWAHSPGFPRRYRIDYLRGRIWIDLSMEKAYSHNQVKSAFIHGIESLLESQDIGRYFGDQMRICLPKMETSCEPDGMFISYASMQSGRIRRFTARDGEVTEFEGTPDMILEVKSDYSEEMDEFERPAIYFAAGVDEFWRADGRKDRCQFELLLRGEQAYRPSEVQDGWQWSPFLRRWLRLLRTTDLLGDARFRLLAKE